jgi:hypothetical protein
VIDDPMLGIMSSMRLRDIPDPRWVHLVGWVLIAAVAASFLVHSWAVLWILLGLVYAYVAGGLLLRTRRRRRMSNR